jgi:hypothetical protein
MDSIREAELLKRNGNLTAVRGRPSVKIDHVSCPSLCMKIAGTPEAGRALTGEAS